MNGQVFYRRLGHDYPVVDHGEGVYLYDAAGRRYLDAAGGALVANIGHGVAEIADVLREQAARVAFAHGTQFTSEPIESYAAALGRVSPILNPRAYLVSGGSEVVETAIKLAYQLCVARGEPGRHKIVARWYSYHGASLGALSASGREPLRRPYAPLLIDMPHIPPAYCYRCPFGANGPADCDLACADALEAEIERQGPETVAAFVAEPIVGATLAAAVPPAGYWPRIREICDHYDVLLIADEVMTGFGRTGRWFGVDHWGVVPDILVSAKGASGGYWPLGVLLVRDELVDALRGVGGFRHGFTYANGVMAAAVGLAVLRYLEANDLVAASAAQGAYLRERLDSLRDLPAVGDVRGLGLMVGVELVADRATKTPFPRARQVAEGLQAAAMRRGVVIYYGTGLADGQAGDAALVGPPFIISRAEIDDIVAVLREAIVEVTAGD
jgi:adenosylmethionine-8-amino-7-oxononanoate aminotransferase